MKTLITFCFILPYLSIYPQKEMTEKEVREKWKLVEDRQKHELLEKYGKDYYRYNFNEKVESFIDSLESQGIDNIGVYLEDYYGWEIYDSCMSKKYAYKAFVQWKFENQYYHITIKQFCNSQIVKIPYSTILSYYRNCSYELKNEKIHDVIVGGSWLGDKDWEFHSSFEFHSPKYLLYCRIASDYFWTRFSKYEIDDVDNIYYIDNTESRINRWRLIVLDQIEEIKVNLKNGHSA